MISFLSSLLLLGPVAPPSGEWVGTIVFGDREHDVHFTVWESEAGPLSRLTFIDLGRRYVAAVATGDSLRAAFQTTRFGYVEVSAEVVDGLMKGVVTGTERGEIYLRRLDEGCPLCAEIAGEYTAGSDTMLVSFRPRGGMLLVAYRKGSVSLAERFPVGGRLVRLDRHGMVTGGVQIERDRNRRVRRLRRSEAEGEVWWRRVPNSIRLRVVQFRSGDLRLTGTLFEPAGRPRAALAAVQGSLGGRISTRENFWQMSFARALALHGVAVLVPDKRGSGDSEGEWTVASIEDLARDAAASVEALREVVPRSRRYGIAGLSEGGWVAPAAALRVRGLDALVMVSTSMLPVTENSEYEIRQLAREAGLSEGDVEKIVGLQVLAARYAGSPEPGAWRRYVERRRELLADSNVAGAVQPFPVEPGHPRVVQFVHRMGFDPAPALARTTLPIFSVWGGRDIRVPGALSYRRLDALLDRTGLSANRELALYDTSGHGIEDPGTGLLRADFVDRLVRWLERLPPSHSP